MFGRPNIVSPAKSPAKKSPAKKSPAKKSEPDKSEMAETVEPSVDEQFEQENKEEPDPLNPRSPARPRIFKADSEVAALADQLGGLTVDSEALQELRLELETNAKEIKHNDFDTNVVFPSIYVPKGNTSIKVLVVMSGPPEDLFAQVQKEKRRSWNGFFNQGINVPKTVHDLDLWAKEAGFDLKNAFLMDAFPLTKWRKGVNPTAKRLVKFAHEYVMNHKAVVEPDVIVLLGVHAWRAFKNDPYATAPGLSVLHPLNLEEPVVITAPHPGFAGSKSSIKTAFGHVVTYQKQVFE